MRLFDRDKKKVNKPTEIPEVTIIGTKPKKRSGIDTKTVAKKIFNEEKRDLRKLNLKEIIQVDFPNDQYIRTQTEKKQIVLHHTVSGQGVKGDLAWWRMTADRVATAIIVGWDGKLYQCFSSKYWGYHLGLKTANNKKLNQETIGIEIDSWGGLVFHKGHWYPAKWDKVLKKHTPNTKILPIKSVVTYPEKFRGFAAFERYTDAQIEAVRQLLVFWGERFDISLDYKEDMWDISDNALKGDNGIWAHVSYRSDKSDVHPDPKLINMLKSLK